MTTEIGKSLLEAIRSKDVQEALTQVQQFTANMRDATVGADYVKWISEPVNLTEVHKALVEDLGVPPRLLAIKRMLMSRPQRAALLLRAIENSLVRLSNE